MIGKSIIYTYILSIINNTKRQYILYFILNIIISMFLIKLSQINVLTIIHLRVII